MPRVPFRVPFPVKSVESPAQTPIRPGSPPSTPVRRFPTCVHPQGERPCPVVPVSTSRAATSSPSSGAATARPSSSCPAKGKSDREARQAAETELRRLVVERDQNRTATQAGSQITVEDLVVKFLERTRAERQPAPTTTTRPRCANSCTGSRGAAARKKGRPKPDPTHVKGEPFTEGLGEPAARDVTPLAAQEMRKALPELYARRRSTTG